MEEGGGNDGERGTEASVGILTPGWRREVGMEMVVVLIRGKLKERKDNINN